MGIINTHPGGRLDGAREIMVWDPLVRLIHWSLALVILTNGAFTNPEGELHEVVGFIALGLVITRLAWGIVGSKHARFSAFLPNPMAAIRHLRGMLLGDDEVVHLSHNPLGALMVYNIWGTVLLIVATGIMMGTRRYFGIAWVGGLHEIAFDWLVVSIALHVIGVFVEGAHTGVPLVRAMFDGKKRIGRGKEIE